MSLDSQPQPLDPHLLSEHFSSAHNPFDVVRALPDIGISPEEEEVTNMTLESLAFFDAWAYDREEKYRIASTSSGKEGEGAMQTITEETYQMISLINTVWDLHTVQFRPEYAPASWEAGGGYVSTLIEVFHRSAFQGVRPEAVPAVRPALLSNEKLGFIYTADDGATVEVSIDELKDRVWVHAVNQLNSIRALAGLVGERGEQTIDSREAFMILQSKLQLALHDGTKPLSGIMGGITTIQEALHPSITGEIRSIDGEVHQAEVPQEALDFLIADAKERMRVGIQSLPLCAELIRHVMENEVVAEDIAPEDFRSYIVEAFEQIGPRLETAFAQRGKTFPGFQLLVDDVPEEVISVRYSRSLMENLFGINEPENIVDGMIKKLEQWEKEYGVDSLVDWIPSVHVKLRVKDLMSTKVFEAEVVDNGGGVGQELDDARRFIMRVSDKGKGTSIEKKGKGVGMAQIDALSRVLKARLTPKNWKEKREINGKVLFMVGGASVTLATEVILAPSSNVEPSSASL